MVIRGGLGEVVHGFSDMVLVVGDETFQVHITVVAVALSFIE